MALDEFSSITRFRVSFCDIDMLQHVNNAVYVVWAETADVFTLMRCSGNR